MSGQDELRERIARALLKFPLNDCHCPASSPCGWCAMASEEMSDAVIAALGLGPAVERFGAQESDGTVYGWEPDMETVRREWPGMPVMRCRYYLTPWERIEEDG